MNGSDLSWQVLRNRFRRACSAVTGTGRLPATAVSLLAAVCLSACGPAAKSQSAVDVDLTRLSSTVAFAELNNMLEHPEKYDGKTVRMAGVFSRYDSEIPENSYYSCMIGDATACCTVELELTPGEGLDPENLPEDCAEIDVIGIFEVFQEDGFTTCRLKNARLAG